jgi:hypothetical protein
MVGAARVSLRHPDRVNLRLSHADATCRLRDAGGIAARTMPAGAPLLVTANDNENRLYNSDTGVTAHTDQETAGGVRPHLCCCCGHS